MNLFQSLLNLLGLGEPDPDQIEANNYAQAIVKELNRMGKCYVKKTKDGDIFQQVRFKPPLKVLPDRIEFEVDAANLPYGVSVVELKESKIIEGLTTILKRPVTVKHNRGAGFWYVIKRADINLKPNFPYADLRPPKSYDPAKTPLVIPIGRDDTTGNQTWRDLEQMPHLLIAGATGRGKTSQIHTIVSWLIQHAAPDRVQLILIDLKEGLDLTRYNGIPHLVKPVCITADEAYQSLKWVDAEITRRGALFREVLAENIFTYRKRTGQFLNNVVFVFDEITNLGKLPPEENADAWFFLRDGAQRARALGIHFIISTQRPSVDVIDGDIKMNFTARIGFGTATGTDSRVILDNNMAEGLDVGDLAYQDGGTRGVLLRGPYIKTEQADQMVREVIRQHDHNTRRAQREAELEAQKRQHLAQRMLKYATDEKEGRFSVETLFERFGNEITMDDLKALAKELEENGVLSPAAGPNPRMVVGCRMSDDVEMSEAAQKGDNLNPKNGNGRIK